MNRRSQHIRKTTSSWGQSTWALSKSEMKRELAPHLHSVTRLNQIHFHSSDQILEKPLCCCLSRGGDEDGLRDVEVGGGYFYLQTGMEMKDQNGQENFPWYCFQLG